MVRSCRGNYLGLIFTPSARCREHVSAAVNPPITFRSNFHHKPRSMALRTRFLCKESAKICRLETEFVRRMSASAHELIESARTAPGIPQPA